MTARASEAEGLLRVASRRLLTRYPFHTHLVAMGRLVEATDIQTMAVTIRNAELQFLFNTDFVLGCHLDQLVGVLHHEVNHVLFGHLLADPNFYPDTKARIIAEEVTANEFVPESLPGRPVLLEHYPQLPKVEDTDTRYRRLKSKQRGNYPSAIVETVDDHDVWEQARADGARAQAAIMSAVERAARTLTPEEWDRTPPRTREAIDQARRGTAAGRQTAAVSANDGATISWQRALRRFVGKQRILAPSYLRPPRRFPHLVGIVPGTTRRPGKPRLMAVIDTSGSISDDMLAQIAKELAVMGSSHKVVIVECDAEVHRIYPFDGELRDVCGRGGTDLRPPFEREILSKVRPDVLIYFTDGEGPAPDKPPRVPVLWCLTLGSTAPAAWGATVWMGY